MNFTTKQFSSNTLGTLLKKSREDSGLSLKDIEEKTGIVKKYLEFLETDDFYKFPSATYTRGILQRYAEALGLDTQDIVNQWKQEYSSSSDKPKIDRARHSSQKRFGAKTGIVILIVALILLYIGINIKTAIVAPSIEIIYPSEELRTTESTLMIRGETEPSADVFINNQLIGTADNNGNFEQVIELLPGLNTIEISAKKKYSRMRTIYRQVVLQE